MPKPAVTPVGYSVALSAPARHELTITMNVPALDGNDCVLAFPVWTPGSYMIRDFSRNVFDLVVTDLKGKSLPIQRLEKHRWKVTTQGRPFKVQHTVFAYDPGVRAAFLDTDRAVLNGTSLFFFVEGHVQRACTLQIDAPEGWVTSVALPSRAGRFFAESYDELVDSPCAVGTHKRIRFRERGVPFEIAWMGPSNADMKRVVEGVKKIVRTTAKIFGGFPFDRYVFLVQTQPRRGGGLEHAASCTLNVEAMGFGSETGYQSFFELVAHEFFHAWNVKRIKDVVLGPFDYGQENYTRLLWFHEGFTDYMETQIILRAGLLSVEKFFDDTSKQWRTYVNKPGRNRTPLSELSFEAWIKQYKTNEVFTNRAISYYEKGRWAAFVLDLMMRQRTKGKRGLPEMFGWLWEHRASKNISITDLDIRKAADEVGSGSYGSFFDKHIEGLEELPFPTWVARVGVDVQVLHAAKNDEDDGLAQSRKLAWMGVSLRNQNGDAQATILNIIPDSPAERAGLSFGDHVIAIQGHKVDAATFAERVGDNAPGDVVRVTYFRDEWLREAMVKLGRNPDRVFKLSVAKKATAEQKRLLEAWVGVKVGRV